MDEAEQLQLEMADDVRRRLQERMILPEDVERVIRQAEMSGRKLIGQVTGRYLASLRPKAVTFWVEYSQEREGYRVHSAYSHRMVMKSSGSTAEWEKTGKVAGNWLCNQCRIPVEEQTVRLQYMQSIFPIKLPACSGCGFILIDEELAITKVAEAEQALEDK
ncbi:DVU_1557 family redox protein [Geotalea sp. SG265]|uniref:DVU_1557 family redox protein n=1 Tax=Geotalea sp. SG265 TaxID=2922867 RepID=UPI001FAF9BAA|nr:CLJU_RS11820 family redox protein [Geotalea sp. SG265]